MFRFPRKPGQQLYFRTMFASQRRYDGQWIGGIWEIHKESSMLYQCFKLYRLESTAFKTA